MEKTRAIFRHPNVGNFFQAEPKLENPFTGDGFLRRILTRLLPSQVYGFKIDLIGILDSEKKYA